MTRVKCTIDTLFFMNLNAENSVEHNHIKHLDSLSVLSLNRTDRLRLIDFDKSATNVITQTLTNFYEMDYNPSATNYHGATEFKLRGSPFDCTGLKSVASHRLVCDILETLTFSNGYDVLSTIKVCDKITSKSAFIMSKKIEMNGKNEEKTQSNEVNILKKTYACISFSEKNKLRLMNFSTETTERVIKMVSEMYLLGITIYCIIILQCYARFHDIESLLYKGCADKVVTSFIFPKTFPRGNTHN